LSARFVDIDELRKNVTRAMRNVGIGNMTPGFATSTSVQIPHHGKDFNFNIFFVARNGSWLQKLRMRWIGNGWARASLVVEGLGGGKELLQEVSDNYPRDADGRVEWEQKPQPSPSTTEGK